MTNSTPRRSLNLFGSHLRERWQEADRLAVDAWNKRTLGFSPSGAAVADAKVFVDVTVKK